MSILYRPRLYTITTSLVLLFAAGCGGGGGSGGVTTQSTVQVSWTANRESAVNTTGGGYRVYYSQISGFSPGDAGVTVLDVPYVSGPAAPASASVVLSTGAYFFKVVAYSALAGGSESAPSAETPVTVPPALTK